jgi:head-tail adaptor
MATFNEEIYSTLAERRASVKHLSGAKNYESDLEQSVNDYRVVFQFRYLPGLNYDCRILLDDDIYVIQDIEKLRRKEGHKVVCERRVNHD